MLKLRLTALLTLLLSATVFLSSCEDDDTDDNVYNINSTLSASQVVPASGVSATGTLSGNYNRTTHVLTYTVTYTGLSGNATALHVHAYADPGFNAFPSADFSTGIAQSFTSGLPTGAAGSYTNTLYADGTVIKEDDILAGKYYIDIHTAAKPAGELRGQIVF